MTEKIEIERLRKKAEPYLDVVNTLFKCKKNNPLISAIYGLTKKDPRSTILQCELIIKELLKEHNSKKEDKLTQVQIDHIICSSHNFQSKDLETAVFTFCNLIQVLEIYYPDIKPKFTIDNDIDYIRKKLEPFREKIDNLFQDTNPLTNALKLSSKDSKEYKLCVGATRLILEGILPKMYFKTFGKEPKKKLIADIIFDEQFRLSHKQHHHTLNVIRDVGNCGSHVKDFPITERYALFSLHSLYIILRWYFIDDIDCSTSNSKTIKKILIISIILIVSTFIIIKYWQQYIGQGKITLLIINKDYSEVIKKINKLKSKGSKELFWLNYSLIQIGEPDYYKIEIIRNYLKDSKQNTNIKKYRILYDLLFIISIYHNNKDAQKAKNYYDQFKVVNCNNTTFCRNQLLDHFKQKSLEELSYSVLEFSPQSNDPFQIFEVIKSQ